jgi:hypothetical protein
VVTGATSLICNEHLSLIDNIKYSFNLYKNNFIFKSRYMLGFNNLVNSDILAMKKDIVDEMGSVNVKTRNDELKYSLSIADIDVKIGFNPDAKIYIGVDTYEMETPSLSKRLIP